MIILATERLFLREFNTGDAGFILELLNNPSWIKYIGDKNILDTNDALNYINNGPLKSYQTHGFGLYLVALKATEKPIGMCGLIKRDGLEDVDIGFALMPEYAGNGFAYEIASATLDHAKNKLGIEKVVAITSHDNENSIRLLNKLGLHFKKITRLHAEAEALMLFEANNG